MPSPDKTDVAMLELVTFRNNLIRMLNPKVLQTLTDLVASTAGEDGNRPMIERFEYFCHTSIDGLECKYAKDAKDFFLKNQAKLAAKSIIWLYHNWAKEYDK